MRATEYWASRPIPTRFADPAIPYRQAIAAEVARYAPESVLEFGAGAGANLAAIRQASPGVRRLVGIDINPAAVEAGRRRFPTLDLKVGDVDDIEGVYDVGLTVSVLCHLDDPYPAVEALYRTASVLILVEPWDGFVGPIEVNPDGSVSPYTWSWDYPKMFRSLGAKVSVRKMPLREAGVGPLYRRYTIK